MRQRSSLSQGQSQGRHQSRMPPRACGPSFWHRQTLSVVPSPMPSAQSYDRRVIIPVVWKETETPGRNPLSRYSASERLPGFEPGKHHSLGLTTVLPLPPWLQTLPFCPCAGTAGVRLHLLPRLSWSHGEWASWPPLPGPLVRQLTTEKMPENPSLSHMYVILL